MKGLDLGNLNTSCSKIKLQINSNIQKKLLSKMKNEDFFSVNLNTNKFITSSDKIENKNISNKNNRTFSMDFSHSSQLKEGYRNIFQSSNNCINVDELKQSKENKEIKIKQEKKINKESRNENNFINKSILTSVIKEFNNLGSNMKNSRTNSIGLYNIGEYHTIVSTVPNITFNPNQQNSIINTNLFNNYNKINKKLLTKTNSGNATNFSKYLKNLNINSGMRLNKSVNKSRKTINTSTNITIQSVYNLDNKKNNSQSKSNLDILNTKKNDSSNKNSSVKKPTFSNRKQIRNKLKVSFPKNKILNLSNPSVLNTQSNEINYEAVNALNFSRDISKQTMILTKTDEEENDLALTEETIIKLSEIRHSIIELMNKNKNQNQILKEFEAIYKYLLKIKSTVLSNCDENIYSVSRKSNISSGCISQTGTVNSNLRSSKTKASEKEDNNIDDENQLLRKENENLKCNLEIIVKKFDKICSENLELREYVKQKTDNIEELRYIINKFKEDLNEVKKHSNTSSGIFKTDNRGIETLRNEKTDFSIEDKNISIDQKDYSSRKKSNLNQFNNRINLSVPSFQIKKYSDEILDDENEKISDSNLLSPKEKTTCFAENIDKEQSSLENFSSISLDSLNKMANLIKQEIDSKKKIVSKSNDMVVLNMKNFGLDLSNLPKQNDFNQEFLENYSDFSPSWRIEVDKINLCKNN